MAWLAPSAGGYFYSEIEMKENDCKACAARDRMILKLQKEVVRLQSRVRTYRKKLEQPKTTR